MFREDGSDCLKVTKLFFGLLAQIHKLAGKLCVGRQMSNHVFSPSAALKVLLSRSTSITAGLTLLKAGGPQCVIV